MAISLRFIAAVEPGRYRAVSRVLGLWDHELSNVVQITNPAECSGDFQTA